MQTNFHEYPPFRLTQASTRDRSPFAEGRQSANGVGRTRRCRRSCQRCAMLFQR
jgi:hypothetical protein